jgi:hypothetical protein
MNMTCTETQNVELRENNVEQIVSMLKASLEAGDRKEVLSLLKKIGSEIHRRWGSTATVPVSFDEAEAKYKLFLSSGTSGTRIFINTRDGEKFPGDLIFPNVNLAHKQNGRTLADAFVDVFGALAEKTGSQDSERPYFIVKLLSRPL